MVAMAVPDEDPEPAGRDEVAMVPGKRIDRGADPDHIVGPAPSRALDGSAEREAGVDVGERNDPGLPVVSARAAEHTDLAAQSLFTTDDVAVFDGAGAVLRHAQLEGRMV